MLLLIPETVPVPPQLCRLCTMGPWDPSHTDFGMQLAELGKLSTNGIQLSLNTSITSLTASAYLENLELCCLNRLVFLNVPRIPDFHFY